MPRMVIRDVAVKGPYTWVIGIKGNATSATFRHQHSVTQSTGQRLPIDFKNLKFMAMQMHRMSHRCGIGEHHLHR